MNQYITCILRWSWAGPEIHVLLEGYGESQLLIYCAQC